MKVPGFWVRVQTRHGDASVNLEAVAAVAPDPDGNAIVFLIGGNLVETIEKASDVLKLLEGE